MQTVVGVVRQYSEAERLVEALRDIEVPEGHISVLSPAASKAALRSVPTTEAEQPGIGKTIGSVVGGAAGAAGGLAVASVALPGVGPVIAAGAIALGVLGAVAGGAVGDQFDDTLSHGLPTDELYVYRNALEKGRSIVIAMVEDDAQAAQVRQLFTALGAESVDAAREEWWIGLRDAEEAEYTRQGGDFRKDEALYRLGFDSAFRLPAEAPPFDQARWVLRDWHGLVAEEPAFRAGYERGRSFRSGSGEDGAGRRGPTDGPILIALGLVCVIAAAG
jgi:hypothetical protein